MKLTAKITHEKEVTSEFVLAEAKDIWRHCRSQHKKFPAEDMESASLLLNNVRECHREFAIAYPIVVRYMCQMREFSASAFKKYLDRIANQAADRNEDDYLNSQVDYVVILYKCRHPKWNLTQVANIRTNVRALLQQEHDQFKTAAVAAEHQVTQREAELHLQNNIDLRKVYAADPLAGQEVGVRVVTTCPLVAPIDLSANTEVPPLEITSEELLL